MIPCILPTGVDDFWKAGSAGKSEGTYRLKFEDDDDQVRSVAVQWVVQPMQPM